MDEGDDVSLHSETMEWDDGSMTMMLDQNERRPANQRRPAAAGKGESGEREAGE